MIQSFTQHYWESRNQENVPVNPGTGTSGIPLTGEGSMRFNPSNPGMAYFGKTRNGGTKDHWGLDMTRAENTAVFAALRGKVTFAGNSGEGGLTIRIDHGMILGHRYESGYSHLNYIMPWIHRGDTVSTGAFIGLAGRTGNAGRMPASEVHVHFGLRMDGRKIDPYSFFTPLATGGGQ